MNDYPTCPVCEGSTSLLGTLGRLLWLRCIDCGMEFHQVAKTAKAGGK